MNVTTRVRPLVLLRNYPRDVKLLGASTFISAVGSGLYLPVAVLYFVRDVGLPTHQVGVALSLSALAAVLAGPGLGWLTDQRDAKKLQLLFQVATGLAMALFAAVSTFVGLVLLSLLFSIAQSAAGAARSTIMGTLSLGEERVRNRSLLRSCGNLGLAIGTALGGASLALLNGELRTLVLLNALSFLASAVPLGWLRARQARPLRDADVTITRSVRDVRYLLVTFMCGLMNIHFEVLGFAIPLWVTGHTNAPRETVAAMFFINTVMVVVLQVWASRFAGTVRGANHTAVISGGILATSCGLFAFAPLLHGFVLISALCLMIAVHSLGEVLQVASGFGLSYELAPPGQYGEYVSTFASGRALAKIIGPPALALLVLQHGTAGWLVLGVLFMACGVGTSYASRWAERRPTAASEQSGILNLGHEGTGS